MFFVWWFNSDITDGARQLWACEVGCWKTGVDISSVCNMFYFIQRRLWTLHSGPLMAFTSPRLLWWNTTVGPKRSRKKNNPKKRSKPGSIQDVGIILVWRVCWLFPNCSCLHLFLQSVHIPSCLIFVFLFVFLGGGKNRQVSYQSLAVMMTAVKTSSVEMVTVT